MAATPVKTSTALKMVSTGDDSKCGSQEDPDKQIEQSSANQKSFELDSCWSWFVCVVCAFCSIIISGIPYSYGIFFPALLDEFQRGKARTALVGSLALVGAGLYSMFVGKVYNRIGPTKTATAGSLLCVGSLLLTSQGTSIYFLIFSYGILFGIASCFVYFPLFLMVPQCFDKRRSLAMGIVAMGPGAGLLVMSPVSQAILDALEWRKAFMAMAGIVGMTCPLLCVLVRTPDDRHSRQIQAVKDGKLCDLTVLKNKRFFIYTVAACLVYIGHFIPSVHMVRHCENIGISPTQSSKFYMYSGAMSMLFRPLIGRLCDVTWIQACYVFQIAAAVDGVATLLLPLATKNIHFVVFFIFYGSADGAMACALYIAAMFCFRGTRRVQGFGLYQSTTNAVSAVGPALGGFVADSFGSYPPAFYMAGGLVLLSAFLILVVPFLKPDEMNDEDTPVSDHELLMVVEKCTVV